VYFVISLLTTCFLFFFLTRSSFSVFFSLLFHLPSSTWQVKPFRLIVGQPGLHCGSFGRCLHIPKRSDLVGFFGDFLILETFCFWPQILPVLLPSGWHFTLPSSCLPADCYARLTMPPNSSIARLRELFDHGCYPVTTLQLRPIPDPYLFSTAYSYHVRYVTFRLYFFIPLFGPLLLTSPFFDSPM
jgi:hypothetical protein